MALYIVQTGNIGFSADESIECADAAEIREAVQDIVSEFRRDGYKLTAAKRSFPVIETGKSYRAALLSHPVRAVEIRVCRVN